MTHAAASGPHTVPLERRDPALLRLEKETSQFPDRCSQTAAASPLLEEFDQGPKMQRSLGLSVSPMTEHVLWKATGHHAQIVKRQAALVNHRGKQSVLSPSETLPAFPCLDTGPACDAKC